MLCAAGMGAWFVVFALGRWQRLETNAYDLGFFDQLIWNMSEGRPGESSFLGYNFFGQHLQPVLFLFALPYRLFGAGPVLLLVTQALVAAGAAVPLWAAVRRLGFSAAPAFAAAAGYLANPYLHRSIAADFHPETMLALPLFGALWALAAGKPRVAAVLALSGVLFKEDAALAALGFAALLAYRGYARVAVWTGTAAIAYAVLAVALMTLVRGGESSDLVVRYRYLMDGGLLLAPANILRRLAEPETVRALVTIVVISAPIALLRPRLLLLALPPLMLALYSTHPPQRALELHYAATTLPLLIACGALAASELPLDGALLRRASAIALGLALAGSAAWSPLVPWNREGPPPSAHHRAAVADALALVPADPTVAVAAQSGLVPRLSQRRSVEEFPPFFAVPEWVVIDRYGHRSSQSLDAGFDTALAKVRIDYDLVFSRDGVEVFRRRK